MQEQTLPFIRRDLKLMRTSSAEDGSKQWLLFDPIQNKYFTIGVDAFELLSNWQGGADVEEFLGYLASKDYEIDRSSLEFFVEFLSNNSLLNAETPAAVEKLKNRDKASKQNLFKWLIHNYLFIRIPLVKPDYWLQKNFHRVSFFYTKTWQNILFVLGFLGIIRVLREWESFLSTFMYLFSMEGLLYYFLSLVFVKSMHELGHAFSAKRYGCRVPTMGVAFLVLFPVLYTDTTNSWMLRSKYQRLAIVTAGIKVELYLALLATFFYSFAPDGILKSVLFIIATTRWISSLLINISPFLRFDGYYALADITESKNLQPRSFAMAKWYLRSNILGLEEPKPETLSRQKERFFIVYALLTWIYRFFLFLGIAFLVYYFAFKLLGIILFLVEIVWFIALPIYKELLYWYSKRESVHYNAKNIRSLLMVFLLLIAFFVPIKSSVEMPALLEAQNYLEYYAAEDAKIDTIHFKSGEYVKKGDLLLELDSSHLRHKIKQTQEEIAALLERVERQASSYESVAQRFVLKEQLLKKENELSGMEQMRAKLQVRAAFDGKVELLSHFSKGEWVSSKEPIFALFDTASYRVVAFCEADDLKSVRLGEEAKFISSVAGFDDLWFRVESLFSVSLSHLEFIELSSEFGGEIATRASTEEKMRTQEAYYQVLATPLEQKAQLSFRQKGTLVVPSEARSLFDRFFKKMVALFIKESSF